MKLPANDRPFRAERITASSHGPFAFNEATLPEIWYLAFQSCQFIPEIIRWRWLRFYFATQHVLNVKIASSMHLNWLEVYAEELLPFVWWVSYIAGDQGHAIRSISLHL